MCCDPCGASGKKEDIKSCPDCGYDTINGESTEICGFSPVECNTCGYAPCDGSC